MRNIIQTRRQLITVVVCVFWLALGGTIPAQAAAPPTSAFAPSRQPTRLLIPRIDIDAAIEAVGQDKDGLMDVPSTAATVAWYNLGPRPGEPGNAVLAGHLDDTSGRPAVFWHLDELTAGDEIIVRFGDKREQRFVVVTVETYAANAAPIARIFGMDFERDLNLITCDGEWDPQSKLYERRLVVYARLIRENNMATASEDLIDDPAQTQPAPTVSFPPSTRTAHPW